MMNRLPQLCEKKDVCCGCGLCAELCPKQAITMEVDIEGFLYPKINKAQCVGCMMCVENCNFKTSKPDAKNNNNAVVYATRIKDPDRLKKSSSGGMFTALSNYVLETEGAVACSVYNYQKSCMEFRLVTNKAERDKALGSKYIQSFYGDIYKESLQWIMDHPGKKLLFIGTGCQSAAFRNFVKKKKIEEHVYIIDIICQGVASPKIWKSFIEMMEKRKKKKVDYVTFKDKRFGWHSPLAFVKFENKEVMIPEIVLIINSKRSFRPSCYSCPYCRPIRETDMTIGDYWGIEKEIPDFYAKMGNSLVLIHSEKGKKIFEFISDKIEYRQSNIEKCIQPNLIAPVECPNDRERFWNCYREQGIEAIVSTFGKLSVSNSIKIRLKNVLGIIKSRGRV